MSKIEKEKEFLHFLVEILSITVFYLNPEQLSGEYMFVH